MCCDNIHEYLNLVRIKSLYDTLRYDLNQFSKSNLSTSAYCSVITIQSNRGKVLAVYNMFLICCVSIVLVDFGASVAGK